MDMVSPDTTRIEPQDWRIDMLAGASGFPIRLGADDFGLRFGGPGLNGKAVSIRSVSDNSFLLRVPALVAIEMRKDFEAGAPFSVDASGLIAFVDNGPNADKALRRTAALMRALPDTPLAVFKERTQGMPSSTEVERMAKQRIGQDIFRASLEDYWGGCCPVTGIADRPLLRASHTKPWAECETHDERLDVYNGFLLAVHIDAAFDSALMTFDNEGTLLLSSKLSEAAKGLLLRNVRQVRMTDGHRAYLAHHRARFESQQ